MIGRAGTRAPTSSELTSMTFEGGNLLIFPPKLGNAYEP